MPPPPRLKGLHRRWLPDRDELGLTSQTDLFLSRGLLQKAPFVAGQNIAISITKESTAFILFFLATDDLFALEIFMDVLTQCAPYSIN